MKLFIIIFLIGLSSNLTFAQDIIVKSNGDEIKSKVLEITIETIKYKEFEFQDGPIRNIKISDVFMIIYENGKRETFATAGSQSSKVDTNNTIAITTDSASADSMGLVLNNDNKRHFFMIGPGIGFSYGGIGLRAQWSLGTKPDIRMHTGIGISPEKLILASAGVKYFPLKDYYINAQFGVFGEETIYSTSSGHINSRNNLLYGPSFLLGGDWTWGSTVGYGFNAGLGIAYVMSAEKVEPLSIAFDLGFFIAF